ncbi:MAG: RNA-binding domain-containing protein, partial [Anaerolineae bacterium]
MEEFDPDLFLMLGDRWRMREGSLRDLKQEIPCVISNVDQLAEFVRDMIAFANTSRRRGKPAYMLYGVDNDGRLLPEGIKGQCTRDPKPPDWDDEDLDQLEHQQNEVIGRDLHTQVKQYIEPEVEFEYLYGQVEARLVSYIKVIPSPSPDPFRARKKLLDRKRMQVLLRPGECWKREGESKEPVGPHEQQFLYRWQEVPYISEERWARHLRHAASMEDVDWGRELYMPLTCEEAGNRFLLRERVKEFLAAPEEHLLIVEGRPGSGKTTFLQRLRHDLAGDALQSLEVSRGGEPKEIIPVIVDLNGYAANPQVPFKRKVVWCLDSGGHFGLNTVSEPERILSDRSLRFLVCLDALDEMRVERWEDSVGAIQDFFDEFPNVKVIVTTRPGAAPRWRRHCHKLVISPLTDELARGYLSAYLDEPDTIYRFLSSDDELFALMRIPLMLRATVDYVREPAGGAEVEKDSLPIGHFLNHLFESVFEHEKEKNSSLGGDIRVDQQLKSLSDLALYLDGRTTRTTLCKAREFVGEDLLRVRNMGVLQIQQREVAFFNELVQTYFAALGLKHTVEENGRGMLKALKLISRHYSFWSRCLNILSRRWHPPKCSSTQALSFWRRCLEILKDLTWSDITPLEQAVNSLTSYVLQLVVL